jgi:glycosyltransferase A (GT-A) superfamily protein (DUF2064 family)
VSGAVAVWVKTPGLSPVKTRLAADVGREAAEEFYRRSVDAVRAVVSRAAEHDAPALTPYWAVAEAGGAEGWDGFRVVGQGEGELGERLSRVYDALLERHRFVAFLGADAPQLAPALLLRAARAAMAGAFVLGPADDGGFYLFAGSRPLPREVWTGVPYSDPSTCAELEARLRPLAPVERLERRYDVDTGDDLRRLRAELAARADLLPEQRSLARWLESRGEDPLTP